MNAIVPIVYIVHGQRHHATPVAHVFCDIDRFRFIRAEIEYMKSAGAI